MSNQKMVRLFVVAVMAFSALFAMTATASADEAIEFAVPNVLNTAPSVSSLENRCGGFQEIAGRQVCLIPLYGGGVSVEGNVVTFEHTLSYMGEAALAVVVRQDYSWSAANAVHVSDDAYDILMYTDLNNASRDAYWAGSTIMFPYDDVSIFYVGSYGPVGHTFTLSFGSIGDFDAPVIDAGQY